MGKKLAFVAALVLVVLGGCQNPASSNDAIVGTWNGTGVTATFSSNNSWSKTGTGGSRSGTWTKSGSNYVIIETSPSTSTGAVTIVGNTLTVAGGGISGIYTRG